MGGEGGGEAEEPEQAEGGDRWLEAGRSVESSARGGGGGNGLQRHRARVHNLIIYLLLTLLDHGLGNPRPREKTDWREGCRVCTHTHTQIHTPYTRAILEETNDDW